MKKIFFLPIIISLALSACTKKKLNRTDSKSNIEIVKNFEVEESSAQMDSNYVINEYKSEGFVSPINRGYSIDGKSLNGYEVSNLQSPVIKFVSTDDGSRLNFRELPVDGKKVGQFSNGNKLKVLMQTNEKFTVDEITEVWYLVEDCEGIPPETGWVFGGYLSDTEPVRDFLKKTDIDLDILIGNWENESIYLYIKSDSHFFLD